MGQRGRPKGGGARNCMIKDPLIEPYEVHIDEKYNQYILYNTSNNTNVGYYLNLPILLKAIMKEKFTPTGKDNNVYTLRSYIKAMAMMRDEIQSLLESPYQQR